MLSELKTKHGTLTIRASYAFPLHLPGNTVDGPYESTNQLPHSPTLRFPARAPLRRNRPSELVAFQVQKFYVSQLTQRFVDGALQIVPRQGQLLQKWTKIPLQGRQMTQNSAALSIALVLFEFHLSIPRDPHLQTCHAFQRWDLTVKLIVIHPHFLQAPAQKIMTFSTRTCNSLNQPVPYCICRVIIP